MGIDVQATSTGNLPTMTALENARSDISDYMTQVLTDKQKLVLIKQRIPDKPFPYPIREYSDKSKKDGICKRSCQQAWLEKYDFLAYSKKEDGLYCLSCVLFPTVARNGVRSSQLLSKPFRDWKGAISYINSHSTLDYHRQSMGMMSDDSIQRNHRKPKQAH